MEEQEMGVSRRPAEKTSLPGGSLPGKRQAAESMPGGIYIMRRAFRCVAAGADPGRGKPTTVRGSWAGMFPPPLGVSYAAGG